jgi:hypothetical protein
MAAPVHECARTAAFASDSEALDRKSQTGPWAFHSPAAAIGAAQTQVSEAGSGSYAGRGSWEVEFGSLKVNAYKRAFAFF